MNVSVQAHDDRGLSTSPKGLLDSPRPLTHGRFINRVRGPLSSINFKNESIVSLRRRIRLQRAIKYLSYALLINKNTYLNSLLSNLFCGCLTLRFVRPSAELMARRGVWGLPLTYGGAPSTEHGRGQPRETGCQKSASIRRSVSLGAPILFYFHDHMRIPN
jgi:hypothetical protein